MTDPNSIDCIHAGQISGPVLLCQAHDTWMDPKNCEQCPIRLTSKPPASAPPEHIRVSIIITCGPGYDRWVNDAIKSALCQGPDVEVIVVYDRCHAPPEKWDTVKTRHIDAGNVQQARRTGLLAAQGEAILFLDADDILPNGFVREGLKVLTAETQKDPRVAGVYPNATYVDASHQYTTTRPNLRAPDWDRGEFERRNFMVISTLTWAVALRGSWHQTSDHVVLEDHAMWSQLVADGWEFRPQRNYSLIVRTHADSLSQSQASPDYSVSFDIANQPITVFVAVSGREHCLDRLIAWLQGLPGNCRLVLANNSGDTRVYHRLRQVNWQNYDVRIYEEPAIRGLADQDRKNKAVSRAVELKVCSIYNRAAQETRTPFLLTIEDDVIPTLTPTEAIAELAAGFIGPQVAAVGGLYRSRYAPHNIIAWHANEKNSTQLVTTRSANRHTRIKGTGFGCLLIRTPILRLAPLAVPQDEWYDPYFWDRIAHLGYHLHLANRLTCIHVDSKLGDIHV